jgi:hypothetical protein
MTRSSGTGQKGPDGRSDRSVLGTNGDRRHDAPREATRGKAHALAWDARLPRKAAGNSSNDLEHFPI